MACGWWDFMVPHPALIVPLDVGRAVYPIMTLLKVSRGGTGWQQVCAGHLARFRPCSDVLMTYFHVSLGKRAVGRSVGVSLRIGVVVDVDFSFKGTEWIPRG